MIETFTAEVVGTSRDDIEKKAKAKAEAFFGHDRLVIDSSEVRQNEDPSWSGESYAATVVISQKRQPGRVYMF